MNTNDFHLGLVRNANDASKLAEPGYGIRVGLKNDAFPKLLEVNQKGNDLSRPHHYYHPCLS